MNKYNLIGKCRLCGQNKDLVRSHIFPESFYKSVYDNGPHRFVTLSTNMATPAALEQKGIRERLMCFDCDSIRIGKYDKYIAEWMATGAGSRPVDSTDRYILIEGVDFKMLRLFQLSLLLRLHMATKPGFSNFALTQHVEEIRTMVHDGDPGSQYFYPCFLLCPTEAFDILKLNITCPIMVGTDDVPMCRVHAVGLLWVWVLLPNASTYPAAEASVNPEGNMLILKGNMKLTSILLGDVTRVRKAAESNSHAHKLQQWGFK